MFIVLSIPQGTRPLIHFIEANQCGKPVVSGAILGFLVGGTVG